MTGTERRNLKVENNAMWSDAAVDFDAARPITAALATYTRPCNQNEINNSATIERDGQGGVTWMPGPRTRILSARLWGSHELNVYPSCE